MSDIIYLFNIKSEKGGELHLTSSSTEIFNNSIIYYPYSGLNLEKLEATDSGDNTVSISGIYDEHGITKQSAMVGAEIIISQLQDNSVSLLGKFFCTSVVKQDLRFTLHCNSEIIKYEQSLLKNFSKTCRAIFGDQECGINADKHNFLTDIVKIENNRITCKNASEHPAKFNKGYVLLSNPNTKKQCQAKIIAILNNLIDIETSEQITYDTYSKVKLIARCDKKYRTCCYSFNNAVNFRGEPHIDEFSIND